MFMAYLFIGLIIRPKSLFLDKAHLERPVKSQIQIKQESCCEWDNFAARSFS